ncbi:MAG: hypothetical protein KA147_03630 [Bacteroidia bacterium]|nr:hypothetical protein [Bacteroidia bacterium]
MKYLSPLFGIIAAFLILNGCKKDELPRVNPLDQEGSNGNENYGFPVISDGSVDQVYANGAEFTATVISENGSPVVERGVCYNYSGNPSVAFNKIKAGGGAGRYTCSFSQLNPGFTYYIRSYAINARGISYGNVLSFTTSH